MTEISRPLLSFKALKQQLNLGDAEEKSTVTLSYDDFTHLVRMFLYYAPFDEAWYLESYPEIAKAIQAGNVSSAHSHFLWHGYYEGRTPHKYYHPEGDFRRFLHVPESLFPLVNRAIALVEQRHYRAAEVTFREALKSYPDSVHARLGLGQLMFHQRRFGEAEKTLLPLSKDGDPNPSASMILAEIAGHFRQVGRRFKFLNSTSLDNVRAHQLDRAMMTKDLGYLVECKEICERYLASPEPDVAKFGRETLSAIQGERATAAQIIRSRRTQGLPGVEDLDLAQWGLYIDLAYHLSRLGRLRTAEKLLVQLKQLTSNVFKLSDERLIRLAETARLVNGLSAAISFMANVVTVRQTDALRLYLAKSLYEAELPNETVTILRGIDDVMRKHECAELLSLAYLRCGTFDHAIEVCKIGLDLWPLSYWPAEKALSALFETKVLALSEIEASAPDLDIPATLIQFWDKPTPPPDVENAITTWRNSNPDYQHILFSDETARDFIIQSYGEEVAKLFDYCYHPAMRSDFFRLAFLAVRGGIYVDADEICSGSVSAFLRRYPKCEIYLIAASRKDLYLFNGFVACPPLNRFVLTAFRSVVQVVRVAKENSSRPNIWETTGPGQISRAVAEIVMSDPSAADHVCMIAEAEYGDISKTAWMAYKGTVDGNWRV